MNREESLPARHVIMVAVGSAGDVHPFVGLGIRLLERGYRVTLITSSYFRPLAERVGLELVDPMPGYDFAETTKNPNIWHSLKGPKTIMDIAVGPVIGPTYRLIAERFQPGRTIVLGSSLAFGAMVAQDKLGVPTLSVHLSPALFRSDYQGPVLPGMAVATAPWWLKRLQWYLADRLFIDRMVNRWLTPVRAELALPPVSRVYRNWMHAKLGVLAMFPEWFAPRQPDWPEPMWQPGFPLYDERGVVEPDDELKQFVEVEPPLVFTPGSANMFGREFFTEAAEACRRLKRRGLLLTRFPEQIPADLPSGVRHVSFVPFGWLLPRAGALIHHGGIGTLSQGFAAAVPQIVMPLGFDQFDNAARLERLGVGRTLPPKRFKADQLAPLLEELLTSSTVQAKCREVAQRFVDYDALEAACQVIDQTCAKHVSAPRLAAGS